MKYEHHNLDSYSAAFVGKEILSKVKICIVKIQMRTFSLRSINLVQSDSQYIRIRVILLSLVNGMSAGIIVCRSKLIRLVRVESSL